MPTKVDLHGKTKADYIYCEDCKQFEDFWKYDHDIYEAGHLGHKWRYVTELELEDCVKSCEELISRCPECGSNISTEIAYCNDACQNCGWVIDVKAIKYTNCFTDG
ncbi:MAG: hypothetical protein PHI12_08405 [Dehalococcoidales bacterium]|nr:hypothetical protein [Dehalococcoidales bacterium]